MHVNRRRSPIPIVDQRIDRAGSRLVANLRGGIAMRSERIAFVSGGMGGLGTAISRRLHDAGLIVAVSHSERNDHVVTWLNREREAGRKFHAFELDVARYDSCAECARRVVAEFGAVDVLINNAGITRDASLMTLTKPDWDAVLRTNLDGVFNLTKPFLPGMVERGFGRIVNIGSVNGSRGSFGQTNYAAAKAGIHGFTMSLALEVAKHGVTVNTVSPGYLATAMVEAVPHDIMEKRILPQIPVGRLGRPEEVASLIAYLCSDDGAFVTGADFAVNGGMHMH
jgi:acetoacetyl-CoA reductase